MEKILYKLFKNLTFLIESRMKVLFFFILKNLEVYLQTFLV